MPPLSVLWPGRNQPPLPTVLTLRLLSSFKADWNHLDAVRRSLCSAWWLRRKYILWSYRRHVASEIHSVLAWVLCGGVTPQPQPSLFSLPRSLTIGCPPSVRHAFRVPALWWSSPPSFSLPLLPATLALPPLPCAPFGLLRSPPPCGHLVALRAGRAGQVSVHKLRISQSLVRLIGLLNQGIGQT